MPTNPPHGIQRVTVRIAYEDPYAAIAFLERAFGFPEIAGQRLEAGTGNFIPVSYTHLTLPTR